MYEWVCIILNNNILGNYWERQFENNVLLIWWTMLYTAGASVEVKNIVL